VPVSPLQDQLQSALGTAYTIERELGGGGMSRVFVARENSLGRLVVIKVLPDEMAGQVSMDRFRREITLAAQLQHPHIVPLLSAGEVGGLPYFTMPYVRGESLRARLASHGEMPVHDAVRVLREVASALASAHDEGVVHRDIKPDNVLLSGGAAMVTDFGVAKALSASSTGGDSGLTSMGVALGTPAYMSPEQATADPHADSRADVYSWGVLAYELLTGATPFAGRPAQMMLAAHVTEAPEPIAKRRPNIPAPLATLIMRCLEKRPADRPQRAQEIVQALDAIITPSGGMEPTTAQPATRTVAVEAKPARGRGAIVGMIAAAVVVVIAGGVFFTRSGHATNGAASASGLATKSVAVLPFVNVGGDTANEYFADGLTEDLASALARTDRLRVAARSSSFAYKGKTPTPAEVGKQLNVGTVVEGSVQRAGGRLKVRASLVNAADGLTMWSDTYERDDKDVFAVQSELAQAIAGALRVSLTGEEIARGVGTANQAAHDLVLRGRYQADLYRHSSLLEALKLFDQAIALDSNYADAWAGVAGTWGRLADDYIPAMEALPHMRTAIARALALDSTSAEAHTQLASMLAFYDRDYAAAQREFERALQKDSANSNTLDLFASLLEVRGMRDSAIAVMHRADRLDPLSLILARNETTRFIFANDLPDARSACTRARELDSLRFGGCGFILTLAEGQLPMSVDSLRALARGDSSMLGGLAYVEAKRGMKVEARRDLAAFIARSERARRYVDGTLPAEVYALTGDKDNAMKWLELEYAANGSGMVELRLFPDYRSLYGDPRFEALVKKVGLK
jgi:serine/threonine-protein kinase